MTRPVNRSLGAWRFAALAVFAMALPSSAIAVPVEGCSGVSTCSAGLLSSASTATQYNFTAIQGGYALPSPLVGGQNTFSDGKASQTAAPVTAAVGVIGANQASNNPFHSAAIASAQTDFGTNRAVASTTFGISGVDDRGGGTQAHVDVRTSAVGLSLWRDVWSFSAAGHFGANIALDGHSSRLTDNVLFPSSFQHGTGTIDVGNWNYSLEVWDISNLSPDPDGLLAPTLVTSLESIGVNEQRNSFASLLALDFDFLSGVSYVVRSRLEVFATNGRTVDLYNTVSLRDILLSNGAQLNALSGHDYFGSVVAPVPEPSTWALLATGLFAVAGVARRRRRD